MAVGGQYLLIFDDLRLPTSQNIIEYRASSIEYQYLENTITAVTVGPETSHQQNLHSTEGCDIFDNNRVLAAIGACVRPCDWTAVNLLKF